MQNVIGCWIHLIRVRCVEAGLLGKLRGIRPLRNRVPQPCYKGTLFMRLMAAGVFFPSPFSSDVFRTRWACVIITCTPLFVISQNATCTPPVVLSLPSCSETTFLSRHVWCTWFSLPGILTVHVSGCGRRRLLVTLIRAWYLPALVSDGRRLVFVPKSSFLFIFNSQLWSFYLPFYLLFRAWTCMSACSC